MNALGEHGQHIRSIAERIAAVSQFRFRCGQNQAHTAGPPFPLRDLGFPVQQFRALFEQTKMLGLRSSGGDFLGGVNRS